jgi:hypothetical protein
MKIGKRTSVAYAITIIILLSLNLRASITSSIPSQLKQQSPIQNTTVTTMSSLPIGKTNMTFTSDITMNLTSGSYINFTSGIRMNLTSGVTISFTPFPGQPNPGIITPCWIGQMVGPVAPPGACTWWEILDASGNATGYEFHVDATSANQFHVDIVLPVPYIIPGGGGVIQAEQKIYEIYPCTTISVKYPVGYLPPVCSWWEIIYPVEWQGIEFHVDFSSPAEIHIDKVIGTIVPLPVPPYQVVAEQKITTVQPCQYFVTTVPGLVPDKCSWWEIVYPGDFNGYEFHVDEQYSNGTFHIDSMKPGSITFPTPVYNVTAEKKINTIQPCTYLRYVNNTLTVPQPCDWWEITYPPSAQGYEFHVDYANDTYIHVDDVRPSILTGITEYQLTAERKITSISPCDWFKVIDPPGWHPDICSWWNIVTPTAWSGTIFHVDNFVMNVVYYKFHLDYLGGTLPPPPTPPPWNVTAVPIDPPMYWKKGFVDYAPSGMPDFDERQWLTYNWSQANTWTHCSPTAVANSLWWLDSEFERGIIPPPTVSDSFRLVSSYATMPPFWDDHDPRNVPPLIEHLAYLMDTDGRRTGIAHMGTAVVDMEVGLAQYLQWTGVNPIGDVNGDGVVNGTDLNIVTAALGSQVVGGVPTPGWNMAADIYPVTTGWPNRLAADNKVTPQDVALVTANMGKTGMFNERTILFPDFSLIESEVEKCEDVVLALGFWINNAGVLERYNYTDLYPNTGRNGHTVTVAGVNSTSFKIAISDPAFDAYESGLTSEGRIPVPHVHAAEPPYVTHNNASLVSQDVYSVVYLPPSPPSFPGGWAIVNYAGMLPPVFTVIEGAVITSPSGVHDVAVTNVTSSKADCSIGMPTVGQNYTLRVNVTVANLGTWNETFNVTAYANSTTVASQNITLANGTSTIVTLVWNTTGFTKSNYTISSAADIVPADANTTNNNMTDGMVLVTFTGDVTADRKVRVDDVLAVALRFGTNRDGPPNSNGYHYDSNCDITDDDKIRIDDVLAAAQHFGLGPW